MTEPQPSKEEPVAANEHASINRHFKREGWWMVWLAVGIPLVLLLVAVLAGPALLNLLGR